MKSIITSMVLFLSVPIFAQSIYFPSKLQSSSWDTLSPQALGWCLQEIDSLYQFLEIENTKAFIVLIDGKIVLEKYFGTFTKDSSWYWASAGKTVSAVLTGIAQQEGLLSISDSTSKYLGQGWTSCTPVEEGKISIWNQLTMTSGLDDSGNVDCTIDTCLNYKADAGTRWAYHNAPYTLIENVVEQASNSSYQSFTNTRLFSKTGMQGLWLKIGFNNVFFSKARSMARFGLLIQANGTWNGDSVLTDQTYYNDMINSSQPINPSYGYLWWLNGKSNFKLPSTQFTFSGPLFPDAPTDMIAALGKNGQIVNISKNKRMVMIRMGNPPSGAVFSVPTAFCNQIWQHLNQVMCATSSVKENPLIKEISVFPIPTHSLLNIIIPSPMQLTELTLYDLEGKELIKSIDNQINTHHLKSGLYLLRIVTSDGVVNKRIIKR